MLSRSERHDTRDVHPTEARVISVGHLLWAAYRKSRKSETLGQSGALYAACELVWQAKRELRAELRANRALASAACRARFAALKVA